MGAGLASIARVSAIGDYVRGTKRKYSQMGNNGRDDEMEKVIDVALHTPKRKKICSTVAYIYQALFVEGKDSDVSVVALGQSFPLHRIYLSQSPYFASMFSGDWRESQMDTVHIDIVDPVITPEAFRTVLGALYSDEVHLEPLGIVGVLAGATMLQLSGLIDRCAEVMLETINPHTALYYYDAACKYGDSKLRANCFQWFLVNLMPYYLNNFNYLRTVPLSLMELLVADADLCVLKTEISLYVLLTYWIYMRLHPDEFCTNEHTAKIREYYLARRDEPALLDTELGAEYCTVFRSLRLQHLILHHSDVEMLLRDNIIPRDWLNDRILDGWHATLRVNQNEEKGPRGCPDDVFLAASMRCARTLPTCDKHVWRWTGFHYGLDLVMIADSKSLMIKRNHRPEFEQLLSLQTQRHVIVRVTALTLNEQRQIVAQYTSGIRSVALARSEDVTLIQFPANLTFPLLIAVNVLFTTPSSLSAKSGKTIEQTKVELQPTIPDVVLV